MDNHNCTLSSTISYEEFKLESSIVVGTRDKTKNVNCVPIPKIKINGKVLQMEDLFDFDIVQIDT